MKGIFVRADFGRDQRRVRSEIFVEIFSGGQFLKFNHFVVGKIDAYNHFQPHIVMWG
jgi:hypothetical protein